MNSCERFYEKDGDLYLKYLQQAERHLAGFGDLGGKKEKQQFRSALELLKLIESALDEEEGENHEK